MSLDGYVAGPSVSIRDGMGVGGERLHEWMFAGGTAAGDGSFSSTAAEDAAEINLPFKSVGSVLVGRRTSMWACSTGTTRPTPCPRSC